VPAAQREQCFVFSKAFFLMRSIFCFAVAAIAMSIFAYYMYYLRDGSIGWFPPSMNMVVIHLVFYGVLFNILFHGIRNLYRFFNWPRWISLGEDGIHIHGWFHRHHIPWDRVEEVKLLEKKRYHKKEGYWTSDFFYQITEKNGQKTGLSREGMDRTATFLDTLKRYVKVKREQKEVRDPLPIWPFF
jgi:hypothetical protein